MTIDTNCSRETPRESRRAWLNPWNWPIGIWVLVIGAALMLVPFAVRAVVLSGIPAMDEPFDVDEFARWDGPAGDDAFADYRQASQIRAQVVADMVSHGARDPENFNLVLDQGWTAADEAIQQWLELNRESLTVWKRGTGKQGGLNAPPDILSLDSSLDVVQDLRFFACLALVEQARCLHEGQYDDAWQWARAAYRCGGHASRRGCLVQALVGTAIHAMSSNGLQRWAEQPAVTSVQLREALAALREDRDLYESRSNILKAEYLVYHNGLRSGRWLEFLGPLRPANRESKGLTAVVKMGYWVIGEPELSVRILRQVLANQIREIDKPAAARRKPAGAGTMLLFDSDPAVPLMPGQLDPDGIDKAIARSFLIPVLAPSIKRFDGVLLRQAGRQAALEALLAAQAYRRDHGEFPENLSLLVPQYLEAIPPDPCALTNGPILYRRDKPLEALVWSVSEDGVDGGGDVDSSVRQAPDAGFVLK